MGSKHAKSQIRELFTNLNSQSGFEILAEAINNLNGALKQTGQEKPTMMSFQSVYSIPALLN